MQTEVDKLIDEGKIMTDIKIQIDTCYRITIEAKEKISHTLSTGDVTQAYVMAIDKTTGSKLLFLPKNPEEGRPLDSIILHGNKNFVNLGSQYVL